MPNLFGSSSSLSSSSNPSSPISPKRLSFQKRETSPVKVFNHSSQGSYNRPGAFRGKRLANHPISPPSPPLQHWLPQNESLTLYQDTVQLIHKLYSFPNFERFLFPEGIDAVLQKRKDNGVIDPIAVLWGCFRLGAPLCALFNHLELPNQKQKLPVPNVEGLTTYDNSCKRSIYLFLVACKDELKFPDSLLFTVSDVYKDDTNGLLKAMKTVNAVLDEMARRGKLPIPGPRLPFWKTDVDDASPGSPRSPDFSRRCAIQELIQTERKYAASLQRLQAYRDELFALNVVHPDAMHAIFSDLDRVIDFETRFLIALEAMLSIPSSEQRIGALFASYEENFNVYAPMCGNYDRATRTIQLYGHVLSQVKSMEPYRELQSYLIKPVQRICQYPLILEEILKYSDKENDPYYNELELGIAAMRRVTERINEAKRFEENKKMKEDLLRSISDWKGLDTSTFGELLLRDTFVIRTVEKEYVLYLFENILVCCKYANRKEPSKRDSKIEEEHLVYKDKIQVDSIYQVFDLSRPIENIFELRIDWMDGSTRETFRLKCRNHEQAKLWCQRLEFHVNRVRSGYGSLMRRQLNVNTTSLPPKSSARSSSVTPIRTNLNQVPSIQTAPPFAPHSPFPPLSPASTTPQRLDSNSRPSSSISQSSSSANPFQQSANSNLPSHYTPPYPSPSVSSSLSSWTPSIPSNSLNRSSYASGVSAATTGSSLDRKSIASAESLSRRRNVGPSPPFSGSSHNQSFSSLAHNRMSTTSRVLFDIDKVLSTEFDGIDLSPEDIVPKKSPDTTSTPDHNSSLSVSSASQSSSATTTVPISNMSSTRRHRRDHHSLLTHDQVTLNESRVMQSLMHIAEAEEERQYEQVPSEMRPLSASSTSSLSTSNRVNSKRELAFRGPRLRMPSADDVVCAKDSAPQSAPVSGPFGGHVRNRTHGPVLISQDSASEGPQAVVIQVPEPIPAYSATIVQEP